MTMVWNYQINSFIYGLFIHHITQVIALVFIIILKIPGYVFVKPPWKKIVNTDRKVLIFCIKYSINVMGELFPEEIVPFILLLSIKSEQNILIWSSVSLIVNIIYYIGYSVGSYIRTTGSECLGLSDYSSLKTLIKKSLMYMFFVNLILTVVSLIFSAEIASIFVQKEEDLIILTKCIRLFSCFYFVEGLFIMISSTIRMLGYTTFSLLSTIIVFGIGFPLSCLLSVKRYSGGAYSCVVCLVICDTLTSICFIIRLCINFKSNTLRVIEELESTNSESLLENQNPCAEEEKL